MGAIRSRSASGHTVAADGLVAARDSGAASCHVAPLGLALGITLGLALGLGGGFGVAGAAEPLRDAPVAWHDADRDDIPQPEERDPNLLWDGPTDSVIRPFNRWSRPSRLLRRAGTWFGGDHVPPAPNVNALDEAPNSTWFTNRIGLFPMTPEDVGRGPGEGTGPQTSGVWTVVSAKTEGVTPGFNIRDARGDLYLIKFDPPAFTAMASGAGAIANRLFHAAGYNVPEDHVVTFERDRLVLGENVRIKLPDGSRRSMTVGDIDAILERLPSEGGRWRAIASKFLSGTPIGPFDYQGRRDDDPNDRVRHEDRRELRGLQVFATWLMHFDTKQHNSLDMYVEEDGRRFVRHYLIDFASTLGTGAGGPVERFGYEYTIDVLPVLGRALALGFHEDAWRRVRRPEGLDEVGAFQSEIFDPREFKPLQPNPAFVNLTTRDAYWAAKIISAFTPEQLRAAAGAARYRNPEATDYVARVLDERRAAIARVWFDRIAPLEFFQLDGDIIRFRDLGAERNIYPGTRATYRVRGSVVDGNRFAARWSEWVPLTQTELDVRKGPVGRAIGGIDARHFPFLAIEVQVERGDGDWSPSVTAYFSRHTGEIVAVDREER